MSIFKEKKPLIEWEKEYDVWKDSLLPRQHFVEYTKLEAFNIFNIGSIRRNWGYNEYEIYRNYISCCKNDALCLNSGINYTVIDNRKKSLIEWEKEFGFWIVNAKMYEHNIKYNKSEAERILYSNYFVSSWNEDADKIYFNCLYNDKYCINNSLMIKDFQYVNVVPIEDECLKNLSVIKSEKYEKKKKRKSSIFEKSVKINGHNNRIKVRGKVLKRIIALAMSLITSASATGFSNSFVKTYSINNELESVNTSIKFNYSKDLNVEVINDLDSDTIKMDNKKIDRKIDFTIDKINNVSLGDIITVKQGSKVYDNVYSAIDKSDGLDSLYSFDTDRNVNYVALNYNDDIIYSNDVDEVNKYEQYGATVVSVCTDDGFYNSDDIVVKVKKRGV